MKDQFRVGEVLVSKKDNVWIKQSEKWKPTNLTNFYPKIYLTKGKHYTITKITEHYIYVKNACGLEEEFSRKEKVLLSKGHTSYWGDWFYTKEEARDIKLDSLLYLVDEL